MKSIRARLYLIFISGFAIGFFTLKSFNSQISNKQSDIVHEDFQVSLDLYDDELAKMLHKEVKILCWVFTHPKNHKVRSIHVKNTWGKRCNKLLFMSSEADPELPIHVIPGENGRNHLWNKTQQVYHYVSWSK